MDKFRVGFDIDISLEVKPRYTSGILVAVHSLKDYLLLQMVNGTIKFTVDNGLGAITVSYKPVQPQDVCDGQWITIQGILFLSAHCHVCNNTIYGKRLA